MARVTEILVKSFDLNPADVHPTAHLIDDLDLDSIDAIDLAVGLEKETGLEMSEKELRSIQIVQDVVDMVHRKLK